ncbi:type IV secretion system DNA-binding domain-containing protein [Microgenomates group bacterium]|nr:type IV secretion system DNA-binding domain-containing protein [Microgenomates group bacterium]
MSEHSLFELTTGRDSERGAQAAMQFFSALPKFRHQPWWRLLGFNEKISFFIASANQTVNFYFYCPARLASYFQSLATANYPEATLSPVSPENSPFNYFLPSTSNNYQSDNLSLYAAHLSLDHAQHYPLKDFREFDETSDTLAPLLAVLSKASPFERAIFQLDLRQPRRLWRVQANQAIGETKTSLEDILSDDSRSQKTYVQSKLREQTFRTTVRLAAVSDSRDNALFFVDNIFHALRNLTKEESNALRLRRPIFTTPTNIVSAMNRHCLSLFYHFHLTVFELASLWHLPNLTLSTVPNLAWGKNLLGEPPDNLPVVTKDLDPEIKRHINVFARANYKNNLVSYGLNRPDRRRHMYVIGKTGTGKSTLLANMAINDLRNNEGFCFIDPHGDAIETLLDYIPSHRINDVVYFNPADVNRTVKINLFEGENIEHRELIASGIVSIFQKLYGYTWGPRLEHFLRNALLTLLQSPEARLSDVISLFTDKKFRAKILANLKDPVLQSFWVSEFEPLQDRQRNESIAPILNKVGQFVSSPLVRNVVNSMRSSFSIEKIMDEGKILLVNLSQGKLGEDNATLLGAMMITKIQLAAMGRVNIPEEQRRDFYLYVDEFQNFATDSFIKILSEARKYRLSLILANQYIAQIPEEVRAAIFGNSGTLINFVMGAEDAAFFSREYGEKYSIDDLVSLNRHQIINRITIDNIISQPFPAFTLPLAKNSNHNRDKVIKVSRERYAASDP